MLMNHRAQTTSPSPKEATPLQLPPTSHPGPSGSSGSPPPPRIDDLEADLLALRVPDPETRIRAFDRLARVPREYLRAGWERVRQQRARPGMELDCLQRMEVEPPATPIRAEGALVTVITPGYEPMLHRLLDSWEMRGRSKNVQWVVFCVDGAYEAMEGRANIVRVRCHGLERACSAVKGAVYSCARWIESPFIIQLETDMMVLSSFEPLWSMLENTHPQTMAGARPQVPENAVHLDRLSQTLAIQGARTSDLELLTGDPAADAVFRFNGGLLAGTRAAWLEVDRRIRDMAPYSLMFTEGGFRLWFTEEFILNLALEHVHNLIELGAGWNVQVFGPEPEMWFQTERTAQGMRYSRHGEAARVLHFLTDSRNYPGNVMDRVAGEIEQEGLAR